MTTTTTWTMNEVTSVASFFVQQQTERLTITFDLAGKTWIHALVKDPTGLIRVQYLAFCSHPARTIAVDPQQCSYGAVAGPIPQGEWSVELITIPERLPVDVTMSVTLDDLCHWRNGVHARDYWLSPSTTHLQLTQYSFDEIYNEETRWYRGDFHTHTTISDGKMTVADGYQSAREQQLDFFVATDHNMLPTMWKSGEILVIPGMEITASLGHFNAHGLTKFIDWRPLYTEDGGMETEVGMNRIIAEVKENGALVVVNHPELAKYEWRATETRLADLDGLEICNDPTYGDNTKATEEALLLWSALWNDGYFIAGLGGSDSHLRPDERYEGSEHPSLIGDPTTYVWCETLTAANVLRAVVQRRTYMTRFGTFTPYFTWNGETVHVGTNVASGGTFTVDIEFNYAEPLIVEVIENGACLATVPVEGKDSFRYEWQWNDGDYRWLRCDIRNRQGEFLGTMTPISSGRKQPTLTTWGELRTSVFGAR